MFNRNGKSGQMVIIKDLDFLFLCSHLPLDQTVGHPFILLTPLKGIWTDELPLSSHSAVSEPWQCTCWNTVPFILPGRAIYFVNASECSAIFHYLWEAILCSCVDDSSGSAGKGSFQKACHGEGHEFCELFWFLAPFHWTDSKVALYFWIDFHHYLKFKFIFV